MCWTLFLVTGGRLAQPLFAAMLEDRGHVKGKGLKGNHYHTHKHKHNHKSNNNHK